MIITILPFCFYIVWLFLLIFVGSRMIENVSRVWEMSCFQLKVEMIELHWILAIFNNKPYMSF